MAYAMTKQGSLDNCITYEFICDTVADMNAIENRYRTIGTVAIVLSGESEGLEVYIAGSDKQWNNIGAMGASGDTGTGGLSIYICAQNEVSNGVPNIQDPDETTVYLVAAGATSGNLYEEYIYVNNAWEKFGAANINLSGYATIADTVLTTTLSRGRKANTTVGEGSFAFGDSVTSSGDYSHAEGYETKATGDGTHSEGEYSVASGFVSHAEGQGGTYTLNGTTYESKAAGTADHTEGYQCLTASSMPGNHAEGYQTQATGGGAHAEGYRTLASGSESHAEGGVTKASNFTAHAEGNSTTASGSMSHAEGNNTTASGSQAHAEGSNTIASGYESHAEGMGGTYTINGTTYTSQAAGTADHTEGYQCLTAIAMPGNHAEGYQTQATGGGAHSEGYCTTASGQSSHAEGEYTIAKGSSSHVSGAYNVEDDYSNWTEWVANTSYSVGDKVKVTNGSTIKGYICKTANSDSSFTNSKWINDNKINYAEIIGNGSADDARANARTLDWDGNERLKGDLYVGCSSDSTGGVKIARIPDPPTTDGTYTLQATVASGIVTYTWVAGV